MDYKDFLSILSVAEKLKCSTRHSDTSSGRRESVAEHSWRLALMAMLLEDEFSDVNISKVIKMCLIHDLGEAFTGEQYETWVSTFPEFQKMEFQTLLKEMLELETKEAKLYNALDKMEAVIQHNETDIRSWIPLEYELQFTYGEEEVKFSEYLIGLKKYIDAWTQKKIAEEKSKKE